MKRILTRMGGAAFFLMLGIVGTVERGGSMTLMWWTLPCFAVMVLAERGTRND